MIPNSILDDKNLDWKDAGMLCYLLSKPDNWTVSITHLAKIKKTGKDGVFAIIKNLKNARYVTMNRLGSGGVEYIIFDTPQQENPKVENPEVDDATSGKSKSGADPLRENPLRENPLRENPTLVITDLVVITEKENKERDFVFPPALNVDAFIEYCNHRKAIKAKRLQHASTEKLMAWLSEQGGHSVQQQIVDQTVRNGWTGLFELKHGKQQRPNSDKQSFQEWADRKAMA